MGKILKIGDEVQIVNLRGIQADERKVKRKFRNIVGTIRTIYKNYIYKIQIDTSNYVYVEDKYIIK